MHQQFDVVKIINRLNTGGPAVLVTLLTAGLNENQVNTTLVFGRTADNEGDMAEYAKQRSVPLVSVPQMVRARSLTSPFKDLMALFKLYRLLRSYRPEIVHTHTAIGGFLGRTAAILAKVPIRVHTFHGHVFEGYYPRLINVLFILIERILARYTHKLIVLSDSQAHELARIYRIAPMSKFAVISLGVDLSPFADSSSKRGIFRRELGILDEVRLIGTVGRMVPIKNHRLFLDAAAKLIFEGFTARFVVVGDGSTRLSTEAYARELGIADSVSFTGWRDDLPSVYTDLDLLVISSDNEGVPVSAIEAMASGCPVVATNVGGLGDLITSGETGFLVPPKNPDALAASISNILCDEETAAQVASTARGMIKERFTADRYVSDIIDLYEILKTSNRAATRP